MKLDRSKLEALAALPDDKLWAEIVKMAATYGLTLPKDTPSHTELEKMREVALGAKINMSDAMRLINQYRNK